MLPLQNLKQIVVIRLSVLLLQDMRMPKKFFRAAADAEISAMAELAKKENVAELIRLTTLFSNLMKKKFDELK